MRTLTTLTTFSILLMVLVSAKQLRAQTENPYQQYRKEAVDFFNHKEYYKAGESFSKAFTWAGDKGLAEDRLNAARAYSLGGNTDSAFRQLFRVATMSDYFTVSKLVSLPDLQPLYKDERWGELLAYVEGKNTRKEEKVNKVAFAILQNVLDDDQKYRRQLDSIEREYGRNSAQLKDKWKQISQHDSINLIKVKKVLDSHGWLGPEEVGQEGSRALFLVIQHADINTQEKYLPMLKQAVKDGKADKTSLALLTDRVALYKTGKQIYGSQILSTPEGTLYVPNIIDPDNVDHRRAEMGLEPMAEYVKQWNISWNLDLYKKQQLFDVQKAKGDKRSR